jgi:RNA polymerase sigma factor (sigma-70 family)
MEYNIHHLDLIEPANQQPLFVEEVQKKMRLLQKMLLQYPKELVMDIFVSREGNHDYTVTASLNLKSKEVVVKESGSKAVIVVNNTLDKLRTLVKEQIRLERREYLRNRKNRFHSVFTTTPSIKGAMKNDDQDAFTTLTKKGLPELEKYIRRQISKKPVLVRLLKKNIISVNDIVDEVYGEFYHELKAEAEASEKLELWLYSLADREINRLNEEYGREFREHLSTEQLSKQEWKEMQEELTANADFMPVLREELDDQFYSPGSFDLVEILSDAGAEEEILSLAESGDAEVQQFLRDLPEDQLDVFELYYIHHLDILEIAKAKKIPEDKVIRWIKEARETLLRSFRQHA